ncbi:MAG: glutathione-regulated potassium-efflux system protein KefB [Methyloprofundus sp.]|nr:MAG: glutathione-regulated potassium-efflux system protein KefB [Methyloprofundus sp.]
MITVPAFQAIKLGAVPGFLVAGILVGPYGLKLINNVTGIAHLAEMGVVLLLFVIGIELKPARLWRMRRLVFGLGALQVIITGALLSAVAYFFFHISLRAAILIGPALALSSTAFVLQILTEQKSLTSTFGRTSFSVLLLQDLAVVPLLALLPLLAMSELSIGADIGLALVQSLAILSIVIVTGRYILHPILHRVALSGNPEVFTASALLIVLGAAVLLEHIGLSMAMGAFLAGLLVSDSSYKHQVLAEIQPFRGLLLGLFFMSMGMAFNLNLLIERPLISVELLFALLIINALVLFPLAYLFGLNAKKSLAVALLLAQSGEFALVLFSLANQSKLLSDTLFQQLLLLVLLSMLFTPVLAHFAHRLIRSKNSKKTKPTIRPIKAAPIVLAGFGRVGHRIGEILSISGHNFVAIDADASIVETEHTNGYPVFYGDVRHAGVLNSIGAADTKAIIVTLNDPDAAEQLVATLRTTHPNINIYVRGHSLTQCRKLRELGASGAVSEYVEVSIELARMALTDIGIPEYERLRVLGGFRQKYHAEIAAGVPLTKPQDPQASSKNT